MGTNLKRRRRCTDSQQANDSILNIINHEGNENQNQIRYHLTPVRMTAIKTQIASVGTRKGTLWKISGVGRNVK